MADRVPVLASGVQLLAWKGDAYYPFACATSGELDMPQDMLETTTPSSGSYKTFMPAGTNSWTMRLNMLTVLRDLISTYWFSWETLLLSVRKERVQVKWKMVDRSGYEKYAVGYTWITDTRILFDMDGGWSDSSIDLLGTGPLDISSLITPNNPRMLNPRPEWITTGAENGELFDARLIGKTVGQIQAVSVEGDDKYKIIDAGIPVAGREVKLDNVAGKLIFTIPAGQFDPGLIVYANVLV